MKTLLSTSSVFRRIHFAYSDRLSDEGIQSLVRNRRYREALKLYSQEQANRNSSSSRYTFPSLLKACTSLLNFRYGESLHASVIKAGFYSDAYVVSSLIRMYVASGSLVCADKLFDKMSQRDVALYNSIIDGHFRIGSFEGGMAHFLRMVTANVKPDGYTLSILLGSCADISSGKEIHGYALRNRCNDDPFVVTAMIDMYFGFRCPVDGWKVFEKSENKCNIAVWNSIINGCCHNGLFENGFQLFISAKREALPLGSTTFSISLTASSQVEQFDFGSQLHCDVIKMGFENDSYVCTSLISLYSNYGDLNDSLKVIRLEQDKDIELWNATISAYLSHGRPNDALDVYSFSRKLEIVPDSFTMMNVLIACSMTGSISLGTAIHGEVIKRRMEEDTVTVQSALQTLYSKCGRTEDAHKVFSGMKSRDVIAWGSMIHGCRENMEFSKALILLNAMLRDDVKPDSNILATALNASVGLVGFSIHGFAVKAGLDSDPFTGTALIEFYGNRGQPEMAHKSFSDVVDKNVVAVWNSLMSCYSLNGMPEIAIALLPQLPCVDSISATVALSSISQISALLPGKATHCRVIRSELPQETRLHNSLLDMYIKCGCFTYAERVFSLMPEPDVFTWNSMIHGYGFNGRCKRALDLFEEMKGTGQKPDGVTFLAVISSCNHCGYVDRGLELFRSMREHGVEPRTDHYVAAVDMMGRQGNALAELIDGMAEAATTEDSAGIWVSLLSACRVHRDVEVGEAVAKRLMEMEPGEGSHYVQLLKLYVEAGLMEKAEDLRAAMMKKKGLHTKKLPGISRLSR
ncbi:hypothetical protein M569_07818 [Genlisea aurea]|uniref:Pentatricopeptide repeat-containing protein n=1 Tax=Genlisea aurea TaxID=192259 RepID=S8CJV3_9LAMI|nr:hypothetical protein M569_07818 [Genlisea aurea]